MRISLDGLIPEFRLQVLKLIEACKVEGYSLVPYITIRDPWEQARLWRRSRALITVLQTINDLQTLDASFIATCLIEVGPQKIAPWATNAVPGLSWHQWGEAVDCYVEDHYGHAIWDSNHEGYKVYATIAKNMGLEAGYFWERKDSVHVQARKDRVADAYTWPDIDREIRNKFAKQ